MHLWGDNWFRKNGRDLDDAISFILSVNRKWMGPIRSGKEKYGTFREELTNFYPLAYGNFITRLLCRVPGVEKGVSNYRIFVYNMSIQRACKKWPHLVNELVAEIDYPELVTPGIFGDVCGEDVQNEYWN